MLSYHSFADQVEGQVHEVNISASVVFNAFIYVPSFKVDVDIGHKIEWNTSCQVRNETSPEDVGGMHAAAGILTARGGMTSHAAVVARGWGKCCVSGCHEIRVSEANRVCSPFPTCT